LDAVDKGTFQLITRRDQYHTVFNNLNRLIAEGFNIRINFIALENQNTQDIIPILKHMQFHPVSVRFLEEMPFNGGSKAFNTITWDYKKILAHILAEFPEVTQLQSSPNSTSINYKINGHTSTFGLIP